MTRHRQRGVKVAIGGAASVGAILLAIAVAMPVLPERSQRVLCAAVKGVCSVLAPDTECASVPSKPLDGQTLASGGCPRGYSAINGGCWLLAAARPPCPVGAWEHDGGCYVPLMQSGRRPTIPNAQEP